MANYPVSYNKIMNFNFNHIKEDLEKIGCSPSQINIILDILWKRGLDCFYIPRNFEFKSGGDVSIKMVNYKGEELKDGEIPMTECFDAKIGDLDPMCVRSIEIPKLDYSGCGGNIFELKLTIFPFKPNKVKKFLKDIDSNNEKS